MAPRVAVAALATLVLVLASPLVLLQFGWPLSQADVSPTYLWAALRSATLPTPVLAGFTIGAGWVTWAAFTVLVALDVLAVLRGRLPRLSPLRLLALTTLGGGLASATSAAPAQAPPPATATIAEAPITDSIRTVAAITDTDPAEADAIERTRVLSGFAVDSSVLTPSMRESLDDTIALVETHGAAETIDVTGHTDSSGPRHRNQELSAERAETVATYLRDHLPEADITTHGVADEHPRTDSDDLGPPGERRVEITYTLTPPQHPTPEDHPQDTPSPEPDTGEPHESDRKPDTTTPDHHSGEIDPVSGLVAVSAAGTAGMGAGWWLGRRRPHASVARTDPKPADSAAADTSVDRDPGDPSTSAPPHTEVPADTAVIDATARVLLATQQGEPVRVAGDEGLAITGAHADPVLAALIVAALRDHQVLTTHDVAARLGLAPGHPRLTLATDTPDALTRAEALVVAAARDRLEHDDLAKDATPPAWTLLIVDSPPAQGSERLAVLAQRGPKDAIMVVVAGTWSRARLITVERHDTLEVDLGADAGLQRLVGLDINALTPTQVAEELHRAANEEQPATPSPAASESQTEFAPEAQHAHDADSERPPPHTEHTPAARVEPEARGGAAPGRFDDARVHLRLFAPQLEIEVDGQPVTSGLRTRGRHLMALLALRPHGVRAEDISDLLSPEAADIEAAKNLRNTAISGVRALIRDLLDDQDANVIIHTAGRYSLDSDLVTADVRAFDRELAEARATRPPHRHAHLEQAIRHHHGPLLADLTEPWVDLERQNRTQAVADACVELALAATEPTDALDWLERARNVDERNELIYQEIMRTQARQNRPDAVKRTYETLVTRLETIDEEPSSATTQLLTELTAVTPPEKKPIPLKPRHRSNR